MTTVGKGGKLDTSGKSGNRRLSQKSAEVVDGGSPQLGKGGWLGGAPKPQSPPNSPTPHADWSLTGCKSVENSDWA